MDDTAKLVAIVLLASFAIERITAAVTYVFDSARLYRLPHETAAKMRAKQQRQLAMLALGGVLALAVVWLADLRILRTLNLAKAPAALDFGITWLVLFAGADKIRDLFSDGGGESKSSGGDAQGVPAFRIYVDDGSDIREVTHGR